MKKILSLIILAAMALTVSAQSKVFFTKDITPESLVKIYKALGVTPEGRVAVKISTGEGGNNHYLKPTLIRNLVEEVNGTIVECCTAYGGTRQDPKKHWETIHQHGFDSIFAVDLMDERESIRIPVKDQKWIKYDIVGEHLAHYDWMINLAHFKGHTMGGFGGVLKNASIGVASTAGKAYIHSHGVTDKTPDAWQHTKPQDAFLESMAAAAQGVHNYFNGKILYINVMNNMSVDCDCDGHPAKPELQDMGIMASLDPVALDQACVDMVFNYKGKPGDDNKPLVERINTRHGTHTIDHAEKIGLGSKNYKVITIK
ncbi:MAG: DUF362 domain-containing protein [Prevotella sp.]|nr:DUF362 domain-containing protein [Candidatus Prevotella equi]